MFNRLIDAANVSYNVIGNAVTTSYQGVSSVLSFGATILSPIISPISAQIENYAVGDLRDLFTNQTEFRVKLMAAARESNTGITIHSFGKFGGHIVAIVPQSQEQFDYLLNTLDSQPLGRTSRESMQFFSGSNMFIVSNTDAQALHQRQTLSGFLQPARFTDAIIAETQQTFNAQENAERPVRKTFSLLTRNIMLKVLMGLETLPSGTYEIMQQYAEDSKKWMAFPFPSFFKMLPSSRQHRDQYKALGQRILLSLLDNTMYELNNNPSPRTKNIVLSTLIDLIKQNHPEITTEDEFSQYLKNISKDEVKKYLQHDALTVIPFLLRAADNLTDALKTFLIQLAQASEKSELLRDEVKKAGISDDKDNLNVEILKKLPYLDAWYKECLRFDGSNSVSRYAQFDTPLTQSENETRAIPANSMVLFDILAIKRGQHWDQANKFMPERFLPSDQLEKKNTAGENQVANQQGYKINQFPLVPFSAGRRRCPAPVVVEHIFKIIALSIVQNFDATLTCTNKDKEQFILLPRAHDTRSAALNMKRKF